MTWTLYEAQKRNEYTGFADQDLYCRTDSEKMDSMVKATKGLTITKTNHTTIMTK
jgi:hypothetical protein